MEIIHLGPAEFPVDINVDILHRARSIKRDQGDQILDRIRLHLLERVAHARAFQLEHADGMAGLQEVEGRLVVEIKALDIGHILAGRGDIAQRPSDHGQGFQAEKVKLHQTGRLDPFHVELGGGNIRSRITIERDQFGEFAIADHHTGGVGRGVAIEALQLERDGQEGVDGFVIAAHIAQSRLQIERLGKRNRIGRIGRDHLGQAVNETERQLQDAAGITHHRAGLECSESDDLGDPVMPVLLLHIADHLAAPLLAEVDVKVRHGDTLGVQEALEQKPESKRVEIGDGQGIGDQGAGPRTPAGSDRNIMVLGPLDKVRDDQEIARESHLLDDAELKVETLAIRRLGRGGVDAGQPVGQPFMGAGDQLLDLGPATHGRKARQDGRMRPHPEGAATGNLDRVPERLGQIGKSRMHRLGRGQIVIGRDAPTVGNRHEGAFRDTQERIMRLVHGGVREIGLIGGDQRQFARIGFAYQPVLGLQFLGLAVTLQLDIEPIAEGRLELGKIACRLGLAATDDQAIEEAIRPPSQRNHAIGMFQHQRQGNMGLFRSVDIAKGGAGERHQIAIALLVLGQKDERAIRLGALTGMRIAQP